MVDLIHDFKIKTGQKQIKYRCYLLKQEAKCEGKSTLFDKIMQAHGTYSSRL